MNRARRHGFGLIEALGSVVLIAIGIVATLSCLGAISKAQDQTLEKERMQRMAQQEFDDLVATSQVPSGSATGDVQDVRHGQYVWEADVSPAGTQNLNVLQVTVTRQGDPIERGVSVTGLVADQTGQTGS